MGHGVTRFVVNEYGERNRRGSLEGVGIKKMGIIWTTKYSSTTIEHEEGGCGSIPTDSLMRGKV